MYILYRGVAGAGLAATVLVLGVSPGEVDDGALAATSVAPGAFPKRLVDPFGTRRELGAPPRRVVSIALGTDELLLALSAPSRVMGVTYCVDDPSLTPLVGRVPPEITRVAEEPEQLLALDPDLVLTASYSSPDTLRLLTGAGVPLVRIGRHESVADVLGAIETLGRVLGQEARAAMLLHELGVRLDRVSARAERRGRTPRVIVWDGGFSYAGGTLQDDLIRRAGGVNVAAEGGLRGPVSLSEEALLTLAPEVIITAGSDAREHFELGLLGDGAILRHLPAVRRGQVYGVPRRYLSSVSHHVVTALELMSDALDGSPPKITEGAP